MSDMVSPVFPRNVAWGEERYYLTTAVTRTAESIAAKNGVSTDDIRRLNPGLLYPVNMGVRVRVQ